MKKSKNKVNFEIIEEDSDLGNVIDKIYDLFSEESLSNQEVLWVLECLRDSLFKSLEDED